MTMTSAYIIIMGSGEYSDRSEEPVRVFLNKDSAHAEMIRLQAIKKKYFPVPQLSNDTWDAIWERRQAAGKAAKRDYEAAGYEVYTGEVDWELNEAPLMTDK